MPTLQSLRFHLDESVTTDVAAGLRRRNRDCSTTQDRGLLSVSDERQLEFATQEQRVLITADSDFLRLAAASTVHFGIKFWRQQRHFGQLIREIDGLCFRCDAAQVVGRIFFLA